MPVITVKVVKDVVLTSPEQKRELLQKMTDTFISVVGEVARPYTYCIIEETPQFEWSVAGRPLPDLPFLYGPEYAGMHRRANDMMRSFIESQPGQSSGSSQSSSSQASSSTGSSSTGSSSTGSSSTGSSSTGSSSTGSSSLEPKAQRAHDVWSGNGQ